MAADNHRRQREAFTVLRALQARLEHQAARRRNADILKVDTKMDRYAVVLPDLRFQERDADRDCLARQSRKASHYIEYVEQYLFHFTIGGDQWIKKIRETPARVGPK